MQPSSFPALLLSTKPLFHGIKGEGESCNSAGPLAFYFVPELSTKTLLTPSIRRQTWNKATWNGTSGVTALPAWMNRTLQSFVLLNAEAYLADIILGRHLCLGL